MSTHFTATVDVHQVTHTESVPSHRSGVADKPAGREVQDVARLVLRADTLEGLQTKLAAHVALIEN